MRPLELRVRNFRSYAGEHAVDFTERGLVGVVGPIGSGKSSILDAIVFALYGRTPRTNATKTLINQRAADASVVLRFTVEGEVWEAARSIRIKGASRHALYHYADPTEEPIEKFTLEGEVNARIVELLGLDFAAFERSVLLAQGRFAEFLQARPSDRDRVLKGVFGHDRVDRMKSLAKERRDKLTVDLEKLEVRLEQLETASAQVQADRDELKTVEKRKAALDKAVVAVDEIDNRRAEIQASNDAVAKRLATLDEHAGRLPDQATTGRSIGDLEAAEKRRIELGSQLDDAQQSVQTAETALRAAVDSGEPELLERAAALLGAADPQLKAVIEADRRVSTAGELVQTAKSAAKTAAKKLNDAEQMRDRTLGRAVEAAKILEDAEAALERGRHADMAATLRGRLELEHACPVCDQLVDELPAAAGATHLDELEHVLAAARGAKEEVDSAHTTALTDLERVRQQLDGADDKAAAAESQLRGAHDDAARVRVDFEKTTVHLEKILGAGDPDDRLKERRKAYEQLVTEREDLQKRIEQIRGRHDQAIRDEQEAGKALQELGLQLADLAARLELDLVIGDDVASIGAALEELRETWTTVTADLRRQVSDSEKELGVVEKDRDELIGRLGVTGDVRSEVAVAADRIDRLEKVIAGNEAKIAEFDEMAASRESLSGSVSRFGRINTDLTDSRFIRFLLDEERSRLAELGSEHFQRLSAGRYRFADDQFAIVDLTAADATRRADSLSGGETFLASLGLALALAEMVAGTGGRLDSFFLDEGFGTLDPEHLDLAMEGIETLVADQTDRLVVIVSHVPELRDRIEDLIELERNPVTGDTRIVRG